MRNILCSWISQVNRFQHRGVVYETVIPNPKLKLMDQVREVLRVKHHPEHKGLKSVFNLFAHARNSLSSPNARLNGAEGKDVKMQPVTLDWRRVPRGG